MRCVRFFVTRKNMSRYKSAANEDRITKSELTHCSLVDETRDCKSLLHVAHDANETVDTRA